MTHLNPFVASSLLAAILAASCDGQPRTTEIDAAPNTAGFAAAVRAPHARREGIDAALSAAAALLVDRQSADGGWRSDVYGPFKDGDALTGPVLSALLNCSELRDDHAWHDAVASAKKYLATMIGDDGTIVPRHGLNYPVYTAATAVVALSSPGDSRWTTARQRWLRCLRSHQLAEPLGWHLDDPRYGGWGYAAKPPKKPAPGLPLGTLAEPNISATVFAVAALRAAGVPPHDPAIRKALSFVVRCQNFADDPGRRDDRFDDGGFHFMLDDEVRNKAGLAGTDRFGRKRFASYGSATADGLRVLLLAGVRPGDPRATAAWAWLTEQFAADRHPGKYAADRQSAQPAVYFYYCRSITELLATAGAGSIHSSERFIFASAMADALLARQRSDGSWCNASVDVREDDPLVATALAVDALSRCRAILGHSDALATVDAPPVAFERHDRGARKPPRE